MPLRQKAGERCFNTTDEALLPFKFLYIFFFIVVLLSEVGMGEKDEVICTPFGNARLALFRGVQNTIRLRELVGTGSFPGALLDGNRIIGKLQVAAAVCKALFRKQGTYPKGASCDGSVDGHRVSGGGTGSRMKTKGGLSSEIVFCMSPNKNVGASLNAFGIGDDSTSILLVVPDDSKDASQAVWKECLAKIEGERRPLGELDAEPSEERAAEVQALYGIEDGEISSGIGGKRPLLEAVVNREFALPSDVPKVFQTLDCACKGRNSSADATGIATCEV